MGLGMLVIVAVFIAGLRRTTWRMPTICSACILALAFLNIAILKNDRMPEWMAYDVGRIAVHQIIFAWMIWGLGRGIAAAVSRLRQPAA